MSLALITEYFIYLPLTFMLQLFACQFLFTPSFFEKRNHFWLLVTLKVFVDFNISLLAFLFQFFFGYTFWTTLIVYLFMFVMSSLSYLFIFDVEIRDAIFITIICYALQHIAYKINYLAFDSYTNVNLQSDAYQGVYPSYNGVTGNVPITNEKLIMFAWTIVIQFAIYALVDLLFFLIFAKNFKKFYREAVGSTYTIEISIVTLAITIVLNTLYLFVDESSLFLSILIAILTILLCLFILYNCSTKLQLSYSNRERMLLETQYKEKFKQFEMSKENIDFINIKCHDLRKQIRFLKNNKGLVSEEELTKIENAIRIYDTSIKTGNDILDTLLQDKSIVMNKNHIKASYLIDGKLLDSLKKEDIYAIFGNILDNAIEALLHLEDLEKRTFSLSVKEKLGYISIEETNFFSGDLRFDKDGNPLTIKEDKTNHGFGTKSIKYVIKELNGKIVFSAQDNVFMVKALIPLKQ